METKVMVKIIRKARNKSKSRKYILIPWSPVVTHLSFTMSMKRNRCLLRENLLFQVQHFTQETYMEPTFSVESCIMGTTDETWHLIPVLANIWCTVFDEWREWDGQGNSVQLEGGQAGGRFPEGLSDHANELAPYPNNAGEGKDFCCFFFNKFIYFIYLVLGVLGPHCCMWAFSSCSEWGLLFTAVRGLLIAVASLVAEHGL